MFVKSFYPPLHAASFPGLANLDVCARVFQKRVDSPRELLSPSEACASCSRVSIWHASSPPFVDVIENPFGGALKNPAGLPMRASQGAEEKPIPGRMPRRLASKWRISVQSEKGRETLISIWTIQCNGKPVRYRLWRRDLLHPEAPAFELIPSSRSTV